ncbi:MAG TPA: DUF962 domain-containing protein [Steroidobacteraceae bacterium]|nr:DUF962 domain-containing protein [Steroidobacteraceae bacterium]
MNAVRRFASFRDFYPFYLTAHANPTSRRLHVIGTSITMLVLVYALAAARWWLLPLAPVPGYVFAWVGHFFFEHNRPATFQHPLYSLAGDFVMLRDVLTGRIRW